ncbi:AMP-binding protein [Mycobacterium xenopi]|uniref:Acyl-CoA synthetase n=1 Tax=Mycobacterium xenopi TaxID=1789 RepID=A0AAD1M3L1_MYCXE|nr:AMP-binding protein [Mycobacterium xenopi]MDA3641054.1 AMP-binding protein [Mycobacterium xenopi]MDA3656508.1 AMP-binding protein [Mycobacterium xenopi]MDA3662899.1 AMP-binding protein [Mycobacterium xenopi]ORX20895.1 acyl-CoA synthetase [Mycobacterium xenopi]SPX89685.1 acyl-CoA synthetase [Mycobacterium xenopi]
MTTASVVTTAARALLRSRLLTPPGPAQAHRLLREMRRGGTNPVTLLTIAAARAPHRAAIIDDDGAITYRELQSKTEAVACELYRRGVRPGQAVGILCRNGRGFLEAVFAVALVGADVVLVNTEFRTDALAAALSTHRITTVVCDNEFVRQLAATGESMTAIDPATIETPEHKRPKVATAGRIVLLTSGTTGKPKGVPRTPRIISAVGVGATILDRTGLRIGSRISVAVPMFHGLGLGMTMLSVGLAGTILTRRRFDAEAALAQASLHRAQAFTAVPVMLARILDLPYAVRARNPVPYLRVVLSSGDRLDPGVARRFMDTYGDILYNGYGSTEVGIGALATPADLREAPETVGRPVAGCPVRILDENGNPVGSHVIGRVFVGGKLTAQGYTGGGAKAVVDNMSSTGDMGYFDESGRLYIVGREDDMIVSGGENVYPRAVENALAEHPDIADYAVVGVPDDRFGHRLAAYVVPRPDTGIDEAAVREYLKHKVSRFEQPRDIGIVSSIPRNPAGKVVRSQLTT